MWLEKRQKNDPKLKVASYFLVAGAGFEPATSGLWARRASTALSRVVVLIIDLKRQYVKVARIDTTALSTHTAPYLSSFYYNKN